MSWSAASLLTWITFPEVVWHLNLSILSCTIYVHISVATLLLLAFTCLIFTRSVLHKLSNVFGLNTLKSNIEKAHTFLAETIQICAAELWTITIILAFTFKSKANQQKGCFPYSLPLNMTTSCMLPMVIKTVVYIWIITSRTTPPKAKYISKNHLVLVIKQQLEKSNDKLTVSTRHSAAREKRRKRGRSVMI